MLKTRFFHILGVFLCGCLLWSAPLGEAREEDAGAGTDSASVEYPPVGHSAPTRVMFESLLLPGWGQVENGSYVKAVLFLGTYATFIQWGVRLNQDKQDAAGQLAGASQEDLPALQAEVDRLSDSRNSKFWFAGLTAVVAMADAFVDAHLKKFDERMDSDIVLSQNGIQFGLRWSFAGGSK